jgi:hypothetical protein
MLCPVNTESNAGSFTGYEGQRMSAKVGNDGVVVPSVPAATKGLFRAVEFTGVGYEVQVRIFIDRKLEAAISLLTK